MTVMTIIWHCFCIDQEIQYVFSVKLRERRRLWKSSQGNKLKDIIVEQLPFRLLILA